MSVTAISTVEPLLRSIIELSTVAHLWQHARPSTAYSKLVPAHLSVVTVMIYDLFQPIIQKHILMKVIIKDGVTYREGWAHGPRWFQKSFRTLLTLKKTLFLYLFLQLSVPPNAGMCNCEAKKHKLIFSAHLVI